MLDQRLKPAERYSASALNAEDEAAKFAKEGKYDYASIMSWIAAGHGMKAFASLPDDCPAPLRSLILCGAIASMITACQPLVAKTMLEAFKHQLSEEDMAKLQEILVEPQP